MTSESKISETDEGPVVDMAELGARLADRRAALGCAIEIPRNSGLRRTESKKALLKAIEDIGGKW